MAILGATMLGGILFTGCNKDDDDNNNANRMYNISGTANGSQVVPAVSGSGSGNINGTYNPSNRTLTYTSTWNGLSGAPTGGGFYNGAVGTSGIAIGTPWTFGADATGNGTYSGTMTLTETEASQLINGNWYYGYGTAMNPTGEIRGQISAMQ